MQSPSPQSLAPTLRPTLDRGAGVLLVGASSQERSRWVDQLLTEWKDDPQSPLILRISAQSQEHFVEALTTAAEQSLERLRAPGALYDESSCKALPALGGWLFRARAVGRVGILCVLEEIDTWLDRRGWPIESHEALSALGALLEERTARPISIFCTVRASDASGSPAIPAAVAALFDTRITLSPASSVVRDPSTIVSVLAGRSFTRLSLAQTVTQWANVADDEAMIVFSSPLTPTLVATPDSIAPSTEEPSLAWTSSNYSAHSSRSADETAPIVDSAVALRWGQTLRSAIEVRSALEALETGQTRRSTLQLEKLFVRSVAKLPLALEVLKEGGAQLDPQSPQGTTLLRRGAQALREFELGFSQAYSSAYGAWAAGATRPTMLHDVVASLHKTAAERAVRATAVVILSGLRWDFWPKVSAAVLQNCAGLSVVHQGIHWAAKPVSTVMQKSLLVRGDAALGAIPSEQPEPPTPRSLDEAAVFRREHVGRAEIHRNILYSLAFSEAEGGLVSVMAQTQERAVRALSTFIAGLPRDSLLLVAADVGSTLAHRNATSLTGPEVSAFEVLLPHTLFLWSLDGALCTNNER